MSWMFFWLCVHSDNLTAICMTLILIYMLITHSDSLHSAHEKMKREYQELLNTGEKYKDLAWLKESNEKLRSDVIKVRRSRKEAKITWKQFLEGFILLHYCSCVILLIRLPLLSITDIQYQYFGLMQLTSPFKPPLTDPRQIHNNHLINLIKELAAANNKLKSDLVEYKEMLSDSRNELLTLRSKVEEIETDPTKTTASSIAGTGPSSRQGSIAGSPTDSPTGSVTPTADEFTPGQTSLLHEQQQSLAWISSSAPQPTSPIMFGAAAVGRLSGEHERSKSRERRGRSGSTTPPISIDRALVPRSKRSIDILSESSTPVQSSPTTPTLGSFPRAAPPGPIDIPIGPLSASASTTTAGAVSAPASPLGSPSVVHHHHHHYHYHLHRRKSSNQLDGSGSGGAEQGDDETETVEIIKEEVVVETPGGTRSIQGGQAFEAAGGILALAPHEGGESVGGRKVGFVSEGVPAASDSTLGELSPAAEFKKSVGSPSLLSASLASLNKERDAASVGVQAGREDEEEEPSKPRVTTRTIGFPEPPLSSSRRSSVAADGKRRAGDIGVGYFAPPFSQIGGEGERRARGFGSWREPIVTRVTVVDVPEDVIAERMRDAATSPIAEFDRQLNRDSDELPQGRRSSQINPPLNKWAPVPLPLALSAPSMSHMFAVPPPVSPKHPVSIASLSSNASGSGTQSPYASLHGLGMHLLDRLRGTDIRALNRRLKRAFDILELSGMSNSIIENVLTDVEVLRERFRWVEEAWRDKEARETSGTAGGPPVESRPTTPGPRAESRPTTPGLPRDADASKERERERRIELLLSGVSVDELLPLVHLVQDLLAEIGKLRMTVNDLQVEYVKKVEENQRWVEEGIIKKMESRAREGREGGGVTAGNGKFAWLATLFYRPVQRGPWGSWGARRGEEAYRNRGRSVDTGVYQKKKLAHRQEQQHQRPGQQRPGLQRSEQQRPTKHMRTVSHESVTSMLLERKENEGENEDGSEGNDTEGKTGGKNRNGSGNKTESISSSTTATMVAVPTPIGKPTRGRPPHCDLISVATTTVKVASPMDVPMPGNRRWSDLESSPTRNKGKGKADEEAQESGYKGATSYLASSVFEPKISPWRASPDTSAITTLGSKYGPPVPSKPVNGDSRRKSRLGEPTAGSDARPPRSLQRRDDIDSDPPARTITISTTSSPRGSLSRINTNTNISHSPHPYPASLTRSRTIPAPKQSASAPQKNGRGRSRDRSRPPSPEPELDVNWKVGGLFNTGWTGNK